MTAAIFEAFNNELGLIIKEAFLFNSPTPAPGPPKPVGAMAGAGNYLKGSMGRSWDTMGKGVGGAINKGLTVGLPALGIASELSSDEDPMGQGRSKAERVSSIAGSSVGGLIGNQVGTDAGRGIARMIDPTDKFKARAIGKLNGAAALESAAQPATGFMGSVKGMFQKSPVMPSAAKATALKSSLGMGGRMASFGLRALPVVGGMYGGMKLMQAGSSLASAPFAPFRDKPQQPQQAPMPQTV